jgi:tRNA-2-methylthio-N6-dimethylallyladenosine synthase
LTIKLFVKYIKKLVMREKHLYIETYGCQMNVNDSDRIFTMMAAIGYLPTDNPAKADMILMNTCSVRGGAEEKVYRRLLNLKVFKNANKKLIIGVGGCVAQQEGNALQKKFRWLDIVFGTHNLHRLADMVLAAENGQHCCETSFVDNEQRLDLFPSFDGGNRLSSFVTVIQGCDNYCSYCIVPYVRGREVSRRSEEILSEVRQLAANGVQEIILLGQNVNSYGKDRQGEPSFAQLIRLVDSVDGIKRIRFVTSHPKDMSDELIACYADVKSLSEQVHLPAQAGSNHVLALMNRGYTREEYLDRIRALKAVRPGIAITGDMIIGFPGETDQDFEDTLSLIQEVRFTDLFYFAYSARPGTKAAGFTDDLSDAQKQLRLEKLQKLQKMITLEISKSFVGTIQAVMVEGAGRNPGQISGKADNGRTVNFDGDIKLKGQFVDVRIIDAFQNSLLGEIIP